MKKNKINKLKIYSIISYIMTLFGIYELSKNFTWYNFITILIFTIIFINEI